MRIGYFRLRRKCPLFSRVRNIRTPRESRSCVQKHAINSQSGKDWQASPFLTVRFTTLMGVTGPASFRLHTVQPKRQLRLLGN
ncbi:MAG: hypothetical protein [Sclerotinia sclerotiorum narnavirus 1]|nr:MAG: hypothetical protein [Sclerotinia sclerotiorum narnavirus 1]